MNIQRPDAPCVRPELQSRYPAKRLISVSPNLRAHVEPFVQTLKVECLDKFVMVAERHLNFVCRCISDNLSRFRFGGTAAPVSSSDTPSIDAATALPIRQSHAPHGQSGAW